MKQIVMIYQTDYEKLTNELHDYKAGYKKLTEQFNEGVDERNKLRDKNRKLKQENIDLSGNLRNKIFDSMGCKNALYEGRKTYDELVSENKELKYVNKRLKEQNQKLRDDNCTLLEKNNQLLSKIERHEQPKNTVGIGKTTCPDGYGGVWSGHGHIFYKNIPNFKPVSVDCAGFKRTDCARLEVINPCIEPELMSNIWKKEVTEINLDYTNNVLELVFKETSKISETEHEALKYRFDQQLIKIKDLENQNKDLKDKLNTMGNINRDLSYRMGKWEEIYDQAKWRNKEIIKSARKKKEEIKELKQKLNIIEKLGINANDEYWTFDLNKLNKVIKDSKPLGMSISSHTVSVPNSKVKYCECNCKWEQFKKDMEYYKNSSLSPVDRQVYINLLNKMKELERGRV